MVFEGVITSLGGTAFGGVSIAAVITYVAILIILVVVLGVGVWLIWKFFLYRVRVEVFKRQGNTWEKILTTRGRFAYLGKGGDQFFILRKPRKALPYPEIQAGRNLYWWAIREDGEWINIGVGDIDLQQKKAGARFLATEMRYARAGLQEAWSERYDQRGWLDKYGTILLQAFLVVIILVFTWLMFQEVVKLGSVASGAAQTATQAAEASANAADAAARASAASESLLERLQELGGVGFLPAPT